ncbi:cupin domain-containing protein [Angustibacter sp. McL0619]|uniref:cupin domain-containing protein n=1 Tax=Angustibacter sp. McL0619 TaxID=3415676 RepID=UPI003CE6C812
MTAANRARLLAPDVGALVLELAEAVPGEPPTAAAALCDLGEAEVGVWSIGAGVARDTEVDEVFVVLSGRATVIVEDGETLHVGPGSAVRLFAGDRTTWQVHESLRKLYVALG